MTDAGDWVGLGAGIVALVLAAWSWAGRSPRARWWFRREGYHSMVLGGLPGFGLLLVVGFAYKLTGESALAVIAPLFLAGIAVVLLGILQPSWWGPSWFRAAPEGRRRTRRGAAH